MKLSSDETIFCELGFFQLNLTIVTTWGLMLILILTSIFVTRKLKADIAITRWQCALEIIVTGINNQIKEIGLKNPEKYIGFIGTLFLFIAISNVCIIFPWYEPPTGSLSTTTALAISVFFAIPVFSIGDRGVSGYLKTYIEPTFIMLPFNIISEVTRTLALAVRLFGNIMSGGMIVSILLSITPFFFPIIMNVLGLLTGMVQAYIFSILATVYIAAAVKDGTSADKKVSKVEPETKDKPKIEDQTKKLDSTEVKDKTPADKADSKPETKDKPKIEDQTEKLDSTEVKDKTPADKTDSKVEPETKDKPKIADQTEKLDSTTVKDKTSADEADSKVEPETNDKPKIADQTK